MFYFLSMNIVKRIPLGALASLLFPVVVYAQDVTTILGNVNRAINRTVTVLIVLATIVFMWGIIKYILSKGPDDQAKAKQMMLWGIIGLAVIIAAWGFATIIAKFFLGSTATGIPGGVGQ